MVASNYYLLCKQAYNMIMMLVDEEKGRISEGRLLHTITQETGISTKKLKQMLELHINAQILVRADGYIARKGYKEEVVESGLHY